MSTGDTFLFLSAFLASGVEFVEALTIVLAAGLARGWRSSLAGLGAATLVLAVVVAALGPALTAIPLNALRLVVGALLLVFGLQWLRKAILRASGYKALHDEDEIFAREIAEARARSTSSVRASTGTGSRSPSRACCSRGSRSCSSCSPSAARRARSHSRRPAPRPRSCSSRESASRCARRSPGFPRTR